MKSTIFKRYQALIMLFIFTFTALWGLITVSCKSSTLASTILHPDTLKIVQISDVHYDGCKKDSGARMIAHSQELLEDAISQINEMNDVDLVVFSGDSINKPVKADLEEFIKTANNLKAPWYVALGNHEVNNKLELTKEKYLQILNTLNQNYSSLTVLKPYYALTPKKDYKVIFLDGVNEEELVPAGQFSEAQLAWLDKKLTQYKNKKVLIVQHFPIIPPFKTKSCNHEVVNAKEYLDILDAHNNVIAVLSGHYHCSKVIKRNNVLHITTPSLVQYPNAFRTIVISQTPDESTKIELNNMTSKLKAVREKSKIASGSSYALMEGSKSDQTSVFYLSK